MKQATLDAAHEGRAWPAAGEPPNLCHLGFGLEPPQVIKDVSATAESVWIAIA